MMRRHQPPRRFFIGLEDGVVLECTPMEKTPGTT